MTGQREPPICPECRQQSRDGHSGNNASKKKKKKIQKKRSTLEKVGWVAVGAGVVVAAPCIGMALAGFGTGGIVAGSTAAGIQSGIGNVVAGSLFSMAQSAGATGWFAAGAAYGTSSAAAGGAAVALSKAVKKTCSVCGREFE